MINSRGLCILKWDSKPSRQSGIAEVLDCVKCVVPAVRQHIGADSPTLPESYLCFSGLALLILALQLISFGFIGI